MSFLNGTDEPLTYGEALVYLAQCAPIPDAARAAEVEKAIRAEHGLAVPEPVRPLDPVQAAYEKRLAELESQLTAAQVKAAPAAKGGS